MTGGSCYNGFMSTDEGSEPDEGNKTMMKRLTDGTLEGQPGTFWAWKIDGYFDVHHAPAGIDPDGSDVVAEGFATLAEAREWARGVAALSKAGV